MASRKNKSPNKAAGASAKVKDPVKPKKQPDGARETVESIAIAFVLAFLFKTFQAEAYVIPTGSMAPTLYGRHKEVDCEACGFQFAVGASSEIDQSTGLLISRITSAFCSNCGYENPAMDAPVFNGDRILVNKQIDNFKRFDVVVFKNPEEGHVNYIKRLVGLPGEKIRIRKGDVWAKKSAADRWEIQRKDDPNVQRAIQLTVYDDQFPAKSLISDGWPERWVPSVPGTSDNSVGGWSPQDGSWTIDRDSREYAFSNSGDEPVSWLRYRHFQPAAADWNAKRPRAEAELISDFCSFNAYDSNGRPFRQPVFSGGIYWVGDLTVDFCVDVGSVSSDSRCIVELVEGPDTFQCELNLLDGKVSLYSKATGGAVPEPDVDRSLIATAESSIRGEGKYALSMANVDDRLCVWVDNQLLEFDQPTEFESGEVPAPTDRDLAPVGICLKEVAGVVSDLIVKRDIYYRNDVVEFSQDSRSFVLGVTTPHEEVHSVDSLRRSLSDPAAWSAMYARRSSEQLYSYGQFGDYDLADDEYLMFGDNSSMSKDSRLFDFNSRPLNGVFSHRYAVREKDLIGKALFIFWPHGVPFLNNGDGYAVWKHKGNEGTSPEKYPSVRVPFYPNLQRMKKIR